MLTKKIFKTSSSADMVRLYVNVQFQVKPLSTGTSSSQTKKFFLQKMLERTLSKCVPSFKSLAQVKVKKEQQEEEEQYYIKAEVLIWLKFQITVEPITNSRRTHFLERDNVNLEQGNPKKIILFQNWGARALWIFKHSISG